MLPSERHGLVCIMLYGTSSFADIRGSYGKIIDLNSPLLQLILSDEAIVSYGWRISATAAQLKKKEYYNDANTNNKRLKGRNACEPTAEMFLSNEAPTFL